MHFISSACEEVARGQEDILSQQDTGMCLPTDGNVRWTNTGDGRDQNAPDIYRPFHIAGFGFFFLM